MDYFARPFVRSGSQTIFGESFNFRSQGNNSPLISSVSESKLSRSYTLTIEGNFFSRKPVNNLLDLNGLEEFFNFKITEASPTKLEVLVEKKFNSLPDLDKKFDLKITVNGKSGVLSNAFEIDVPRILSAEPIVLSVNETINLQFSFEENSGSILLLTAQNGSNYLLPFSPKDNNIATGIIPNIPPGKYRLSSERFGFESFIYGEEITIKSTWELASENLPIIEEGWYSYLSTGNQIVAYNFNPFYNLFSFDPNNPIYTKFGDFPENGRNRQWFTLHHSQIDGKIYFGLGAKPPSFESDLILFTDFYRFDIGTKSNERLPDLPEGLTAVKWAFDYQGKLAIAFLNRLNFHFFNTSQKIWEDTGVDVPFDLKDAIALTSKNDKIYFIRQSSSNLFLLSLQIGQSPILLGQVPIPAGISSSWDIIEFENSIFFGSDFKRIFEYKIAENEILSLQNIPVFTNQGAKFYKIENDLFFGLPDLSSQGNSRLFKFVR